MNRPVRYHDAFCTASQERRHKNLCAGASIGKEAYEGASARSVGEGGDVIGLMLESYKTWGRRGYLASLGMPGP